MKTIEQIKEGFSETLDELIFDTENGPFLELCANARNLGEIKVDGRTAQVHVTLQFEEDEWIDNE